MKRAWLRYKGEIEAPQVRVLRREGALVEIETAWFPMQLRSQLDRCGARKADILTYGQFVIDTPRLVTPHPDVVNDPQLRRTLSQLDAGLSKWLQRFPATVKREGEEAPKEWGRAKRL